MALKIIIQQPTPSQLFIFPPGGGTVPVSGTCHCLDPLPAGLPAVDVWINTGSIWMPQLNVTVMPGGGPNNFNWSTAFTIMPPTSGQAVYAVYARMYTNATWNVVPPCAFTAIVDRSSFLVAQVSPPAPPGPGPMSSKKKHPKKNH